MTEITEAPQQLALPLPTAAVVPTAATPAKVVPLKFRVSEATARRGLQHVAELRHLLAERQAAREAAARPRPLERRPAA